MTIITLHLPDKLLHQIDKQTKDLNISRDKYIHIAIETKIQHHHLQKTSLKVRKESLKVNKEFNDIEYDPEY